MQKVLLIGNLGRDPEVKYSQQGTAIAQFSVATTERWKDKDGELHEHTEWFAVKAFNRLAVSPANTFTKAPASTSKAANAPNPGTTNGRAASATETSSTRTRIGFPWTQEAAGTATRNRRAVPTDETASNDQDVPF